MDTHQYVNCAAMRPAADPLGACQDFGARGGVPRDLGNGSFTLVNENDLFTLTSGRSTDRFYTNGIFLHSDWSSPVADRQITREEPSTIPTGSRVPNGRPTSNPLIQASTGIDLNIFRIQKAYLSNLIFPGVELDVRAGAFVLVPRNHLGIGFAFRAGLLPEHSSAPKRKAELLQPWVLYSRPPPTRPSSSCPIAFELTSIEARRSAGANATAKASSTISLSPRSTKLSSSCCAPSLACWPISQV